jgi:hypothetical protein
MAFITWALKRQIFFLTIFILLLTSLGFIFIYPYFNKPPTCFDNKQNGEEDGVDCGGLCARACLNKLDKLSVIWARSFQVVPGRYNAVAYVENQNKDVAVNKINYRFRFADKNNVYIGKREGSTTIPPSGKFAIFEPAIDVGHSVPVYTSFEFTEVPDFVFVPSEKVKQLNITVSKISLTGEDQSPSLSAEIKNNSLFTIPNINVIAILYDENRNALASSRTYVDVLEKEEVKDVYFTWPEAIVGKVIIKEIIPVYNIFEVKLN